MRAAGGDVALHPKSSQVIVDHALGAGVRGCGGDVLGGEPRSGRPFAAKRGMLIAHEADHFVRKQFTHVQIIGRLGPIANHDIAITLR